MLALLRAVYLWYNPTDKLDFILVLGLACLSSEIRNAIMRFLCLHGLGTNSQVLEMQTAAIRQELGDPHPHVFEFVEGALASEPASGIILMLGAMCLGVAHVNLGLESFNLSSKNCFAWYDTDIPSTILQAVDDLAVFIDHTGPYDALLGFSQGAVLAAMLLVRQGHQTPIKFSVFICSGIPFSELFLRAGTLKYLSPGADGVRIMIPTAHIYGSRDEHASDALVLRDLCQTYGRMTLDHGGGHEIPRSPIGITEEISGVIDAVMARATIGQ